jgi:hypothetical protein
LRDIECGGEHVCFTHPQRVQFEAGLASQADDAAIAQPDSCSGIGSGGRQADDDLPCEEQGKACMRIIRRLAILWIVAGHAGKVSARGR